MNFLKMEEIESRAYKAVPDKLRINDNYVTSFVIGYCQCATEQHKIDEEENAKALLYAVNKTAERTKKEIIEKAVRWLEDNINKYLFNDNSNGRYRDWLKCSSKAFEDFRKAMEK